MRIAHPHAIILEQQRVVAWRGHRRVELGGPLRVVSGAGERQYGLGHAGILPGQRANLSPNPAAL